MTHFAHYVTLSNGLKQPLFGLGMLANKDELKTNIKTAIDAGYRCIGTTWYYGNESLIGEILEEIYKSGKVKREDISITSKFPPHFSEPSLIEKTVLQQLKDLRTDYIDLYLLHSLCPVKASTEAEMNGKQAVLDLTSHIQTWTVQ
ncbi:Aldo-ket-red domain-containing protein [Aphelenchoides besseyi]|nr:Aldo-ket-red domain-containing protein [Aphelenchoides besseyi]KAI6194865.1 Aldo-ket-red domain-containing protein [Aphelenchoides besseyi]